MTDDLLKSRFSGGTALSIRWQDHELVRHAFRVQAFDRANNGYRPVPALVTVSTPITGTLRFVIQVNNPISGVPVRQLEVQLPPLDVGPVQGLGPHDSRWVEPNDLPVLEAPNALCAWFVVPVSNGMQLRLGSSNGGPMPVTVHTGDLLLPSQSKVLVVDYRFAPPGTPSALACADALAGWAATHPALASPVPAAPVCSLMISSVGRNFATNPSGWLNDPTIDCSSETGRAAFAVKMRTKILGALTSAVHLGAQALIVWDLPGSSHPHSQYFGDLRCLEALAPEMNALTDEFMTAIRAAGLTPGVCLRDCLLQTPQLGHDYVQRPYADEKERIADLFSKTIYITGRWGDKLWVYLDSWAGTPKTLELLCCTFPRITWCPEMPFAPTWAYRLCVPFSKAGLFRTGTPILTRAAVPQARTLLDLSDVHDPARQQEVIHSVQTGDLPLVRSFGGPTWDDWKLFKRTQAHEGLSLPRPAALAAAKGSVMQGPAEGCQENPSKTVAKPLS